MTYMREQEPPSIVKHFVAEKGDRSSVYEGNRWKGGTNGEERESKWGTEEAPKHKVLQ